MNLQSSTMKSESDNILNELDTGSVKGSKEEESAEKLLSISERKFKRYRKIKLKKSANKNKFKKGFISAKVKRKKFNNLNKQDIVKKDLFHSVTGKAIENSSSDDSYSNPMHEDLIDMNIEVIHDFNDICDKDKAFYELWGRFMVHR